MSRRLPTEPRLVLTDPVVDRLINGAATGALRMQSSGRRWYRDTKTRQLALRLSPTGAAYVRIHWAAGKRIVAVIGDAASMTVSDARAACDRLRLGDRVHFRRRAAPGEPTIDAVYDQMIGAMTAGHYPAHGRSPTAATLASYNETWRPHVTRPGHGLLTLTAFRGAVAGIHSGLADRPGVANKFRTLIRAVYRYARRVKLWAGPDPLTDADGEPIRSIPLPARERYLTPAQVALMADAAGRQTHPWRTYWLIAVLTGIRMGNLISARWADVDLDAGLWVLPKTKSGRRVTVAIQPEAVALLLELRATNPPGCVWLWPQPGNPDEHRRQWRDSWERIRRDVPELADTRPHDCRRTAGSLLTIAGVPLPVVGQQLGHAPGSQATAVYARLDITAQRNAAGALGEIIGRAAGIGKRKRRGGA